MDPPPPQPNGPLGLLTPLYLISISIYHIPLTVIHLIKTYQFNKLLSWPAFQDAWFGTFWASFGPSTREIGSPFVEPLLRKHASGVVLDIGPGSGEWVSLFAAAAERGQITKVFGVEPNFEHHAALRRRVAAAGLDDVYEILGVGAEDLAKCGIRPESVDTICTVQCLCSIPGPQEVVRSLYPFLKKGGKWLVFEHVKTKYQGDFVGHWQRWLDHAWPFFFGGCSITRPTDEWLLTAGEWESVDLKPCKGEGKYDTVPHVSGVLVKRQ